MAAYAKDLNTAETAYAAIDEVCTKSLLWHSNECVAINKLIYPVTQGKVWLYQLSLYSSTDVIM